MNFYDLVSLDELYFSGKSGIALPAEIYVRDNIAILQFRSHIVQGRSNEFIAQLAKFIENSKFHDVICLSSLSLFHKPDHEINSG